jgi:hypothetical protein
MTAGLLLSRNTKSKLHKLMLNNPTAFKCEGYRKFRNMYNTVLRNSKKLYFENNLQIHKKNPRKTWNLLREATNKLPKTNNISSILANGKSTDNPREMAEEFKKFFSEIGSKISNTVNPSSKDPDDLIPPNPNPPTLELGRISPDTIRTTIKNVQSKASTDIDGISTKLLKVIANPINIPLAHIFNLSIDTGIFPCKLKTSQTVPIFKGGDKELCDNYRPISQLSSLSKILEKMVSIQLINHLEFNNLLYQHQYGFQPKKSTEHNLTHLYNYIFNALNEKKYCTGLFLDSKKAFDVCSYSILLKKLKKYSINGNIHEWFNSYLSDRIQKVDINGNLSSEKVFNISIIQGSILGPILFLIYINTCSELLTLMFADDTAGLASHTNIDILTTFVNAELKKKAEWFRINKMAVNVNKTKFMIFHTKGKIVPLNPFSHCLFCVSRLMAICHMRHPYKADLGKKLRRLWCLCVRPSARIRPAK